MTARLRKRILKKASKMLFSWSDNGVDWVTDMETMKQLKKARSKAHKAWANQPDDSIRKGDLAYNITDPHNRVHGFILHVRKDKAVIWRSWAGGKKKLLFSWQIEVDQQGTNGIKLYNYYCFCYPDPELDKV